MASLCGSAGTLRVVPVASQEWRAAVAVPARPARPACKVTGHRLVRVGVRPVGGGEARTKRSSRKRELEVETVAKAQACNTTGHPCSLLPCPRRLGPDGEGAGPCAAPCFRLSRDSLGGVPAVGCH